VRSTLSGILAAAVLLWTPLGAFGDAAPAVAGAVEGEMKLVFSKGTQLADDSSPSKNKAPFGDYPVVVLSKDRKTEIAQVPVDAEGHFRINLPAGDYILDVKPVSRRRLLATARPFSVLPGKTVHVDLEIESAIQPQ
jgi:hypothetical protein